MAEKKKFLYLESMRGLAAIVICLYHFPSNSFLFHNGLVQNAALMVDFFFVLSGFVIAYAYYDRLVSWDDIKTFQWRRFLRLYPVHLFTLLIFLSIELLKYYFEMTRYMEATNPAFLKNDFWAFVSNIFLLQALSQDQITFNYPSWSISVEFYTYLIFACLCVYFRRYLTSIIVCLMVVSGGVLFHYDAMGQETGLAIIRCLYSFCMGVLVWKLFTLKSNSFCLPLQSYTLVVLSILAVLYFSGPYTVLVPIIFAVLIFSLVTDKQTALHDVLNSKILIFIGMISYSIYMLHAAIWWGIRQIGRFIFDYPLILDEKNRYFLDVDSGLATIITLFGLIFVISCSYLMFRVIEQPFKAK